MHLSLIQRQVFHLNMKENQHAAKHSLLVEKHKDISIQKFIDLQPVKHFESGGLKDRTELRGCQTER